jgi:hypothetical protein
MEDNVETPQMKLERQKLRWAPPTTTSGFKRDISAPLMRLGWAIPYNVGPLDSHATRENRALCRRFGSKRSIPKADLKGGGELQHAGQLSGAFKPHRDQHGDTGLVSLCLVE